MPRLAAPRRCARPVRVLLAEQLDGDVDGVWWPVSESLADELVELVVVLQRRLGGIVDIRLNWSESDIQLDLGTMAVGGSRRPVSARLGGRPRLVKIIGCDDSATLLVVPPRTSPALGALVMRCAAAMPVDDECRQTTVFDTARRVLDAAVLESGRWAPVMRDGPEAVGNQRLTRTGAR